MKGVFLLKDLKTFDYNIMDAKTAHCYSKEHEETKQNKYIHNNLKRWKRKFKENLNEAIKEGKFKCLVRIPQYIQISPIDIPEEEAYGSEIFVEWLKEKGYQVEIDVIWFVIGW